MTTFTELELTGMITEGDILISKMGLPRAPFNRWGGRAYLSVQASKDVTDCDDLRIRRLGHGTLGKIELVKKTEDLWDKIATLRVVQALLLYR